eukprot:scaffold61002_cov64-Phaeocystis_antarctica.AAC.8
MQVNADGLGVDNLRVGGRAPRLSLVFGYRVSTETGRAGVIGSARQQRRVPQLELLDVAVQVGEPVQRFAGRRDHRAAMPTARGGGARLFGHERARVGRGSAASAQVVQEAE